MNIIKMYMNNVIILILAVRICEDSDTRGSDKRGYTVFLASILGNSDDLTTFSGRYSNYKKK